MWLTCLIASMGCLLMSVAFPFVFNRTSIVKKRKISLFQSLFAGVFLAVLFMFFPVHSIAGDANWLHIWRAFLLSVFNAIQVFAVGCEFAVVLDGMVSCPDALVTFYQVWAAILFVLAPVFSFGFVLSLFKNLSAYISYLSAYHQETFIFSELNQKSLTLATDLKSKDPKACVVFTDVFEDNEEGIFELTESAKALGAICFKKDILMVNFKKHSKNKAMYFFAIGKDETENLNHSLKLIDLYKDRSNTHIYVFSTKIESEILLTAIDKGNVKVRRINEIHSLVNRVLYEQGGTLFDSAREMPDGSKKISAVVVGMGNHGTEMVKALTWFGQMTGYKLEINAFDKDPLAEEKFIALCPELMSPAYNGVEIEGESQYKITVHPGLDVESISFVNAIKKLTDATYVIVALGNDDVNIHTAVNLRMYFERMKIQPVIKTIVYSSRQKTAVAGIKNYRGQKYAIDFIGDMESSYSADVIIDSELEEDALRRHMKWGKEEEFWTYEYNYRSSMASAIHMKARIHCKIPGATKKESELTAQERDVIEVLEHRRWNAYMRAEGYVYSGSKDKSSRNDLGKMHHDLVDFASLTEEEKRKDGSVGSK